MYVKAPIAALLACLLFPVAAVAQDTDNDGIVDSLDNCVAVVNVDQIDVDFDGFGNACDADFNNDCVVNFMDILMLRSVFFSHDPGCDLTGDGFVNFADLQMIKLPLFGPPGPSGIPNICN